MEKIPTAKEILKETDSYSHIDDGGDKVFYSGFVESLMIEFAKLHCEAQAKVISEKAEIEEIWDNPVNPSMGITYGVDKDSILNSYPLENIK